MREHGTEVDWKDDISRWSLDGLLTCTKTLASASKCAQLGRNGWLTEHGGFLIPSDSVLSHKIKEDHWLGAGANKSRCDSDVSGKWSLQLLLGDESSRFGSRGIFSNWSLGGE